jgi:filamin
LLVSVWNASHTTLRIIMSQETYPEWVNIQKRTFTRWMNAFLKKRGLKVDDIATQLSDGLLLINLLEIISGKQFQTYNKNPRHRAQKLENCSACLNFVKSEGLKLVAIGPEDIVDPKLKLILGLIWTIILRYQIQKGRVVDEGARDALLRWVQSKIPWKNVQNFTTSWQDGTALCELIEVLKPGTIPNVKQLDPKNALQNATLGTEKAEQELEIPKILSPEDMVAEEQDELSIMTYISYFRDYDEKMMARAREEELRRTAAPEKCIAYGPGLEKGLTYEPANFTIEARNVYGDRLQKGGDLFDISIKNGNQDIPKEVVDEQNGLYQVTYTPTTPGKYRIDIKLRDKPISGSPWYPVIEKSEPDPTKCIVEGPGLQPGNETGQWAKFSITSINKYGKPVPVGGDPYAVRVTGPYGDEVEKQIKDNGDGTYHVQYLPRDSGPHKVEVTLRGHHVAKSPYHVDILKNLAEPDATHCEAHGPGLESGIKTAEPTYFHVIAKNRNGEQIPIPSKNPFEVAVHPPDDSPVETHMEPEPDGTLKVTYLPLKPGNYTIDVTCHTASNPAYFDHIKDSPFKLFIKPTADPNHTTAFGPGLKDGIKDTLPAEFKIQAKDINGEPIHEGGDPIDVKIKGPQGEEVPAKVTDNGDGTYDVVYEPIGPGEHQVTPTVKGKPIKGAPFRVRVKAGADHEHSHIESFSFNIRAKTKRGENKKEGGDKFEVVITGPKGPVENIDYRDLGDGTYHVVYSVPEPGEYEVHVKMDGHDIRGSPFHHHC